MSTENKYQFKGTQGIWALDGNDYNDGFAVNSADTEIANIFHWWDDNDNNEHPIAEANAHLIAAAPELLQACVELYTTLEPLVNNPVHNNVMNGLKNTIHKALNIQD